MVLILNIYILIDIKGSIDGVNVECTRNEESKMIPGFGD